MVKMALRMYEDSLCKCGHSIKLTQADDAKLAYRASSTICEACAAREIASNTGDKKPDAGTITFVEDLRDTPGAMDPDADDVMFMPEPGQIPTGPLTSDEFGDGHFDPDGPAFADGVVDGDVVNPG